MKAARSSSTTRWSGLVEVPEPVAAGRVTLEAAMFPLDQVADVLTEVAAGRILGRAVLVPQP